MNDDKDLFQQSMHGIKPLHTDKISQLEIKRSTRGKLRAPVLPEAPIPLPQLSDYEIESVSEEQYLLYSVPGVQPRYLRKLKKGKFMIDARLDLHGYDIDAAREALLLFFHQASQQGFRVLQIIHGKGGKGLSEKPILKNKINSWLRQLPHVLAFCSCQPSQGGTGAVIVLLRREKSAELL